MTAPPVNESFIWQKRLLGPCHSERSEKSRTASGRIAEQRIRARFLAALGMTTLSEAFGE
jgi:hypothetical protein